MNTIYVLDTDHLSLLQRGHPHLLNCLPAVPMALRISTQDLRIAAICLAQQATLATCNLRDFGLVPGLTTVDWSLPES